VNQEWELVMAIAEAINAHGENWRLWIMDNLQRGCSLKEMFNAMTKEVWEPPLALHALMAGADELKLTRAWNHKLPRIGPEPRIVLPDITVDIVARIHQPNAALLSNLLTPEECAELIAYAASKGLKTSGVVHNETGESVQHAARTSSGTHMQRAETPLVAALENRISQLTGWPLTHGEGVQILKYEPGQQYKAHFDWFDPAKPGAAVHLRRGGQRVGTTVVYLSLPKLGGRTTFPKSGVEVAPTLGGAIFFNSVNLLGDPDPLSLHAGTPVDQGEKIVATYWQREHAF
jgi:prolyl 4-hydroxylase